MTQKIFVLALVLSAFAFFIASAEESAPVPTPAPSVLENNPAAAPVSQLVPMPDVSEMVNIAPRWSSLNGIYKCPNGDVISTEGYVKKGNENADAYDVRRFFLNDEKTPYAATRIEVIDRSKELVKIIAYFDLLDHSGNRDRVADLVVEITDPRQKEEKLKGENICTIVRKTAAEFVSAPAAVPAPKPPVTDGGSAATLDQKPKTE